MNGACAALWTMRPRKRGRVSWSSTAATSNSAWPKLSASRRPGMAWQASVGQSRRPVTAPAMTRMSRGLEAAKHGFDSRLAIVGDGLNGANT